MDAPPYAEGFGAASTRSWRGSTSPCGSTCRPSGSRSVEASAYFIVAEALTNIVKHAQAQSAEVSASIHDEMLQLEVRDDGVGGADPAGRALVGLNDRVARSGGGSASTAPPAAAWS